MKTRVNAALLLLALVAFAAVPAQADETVTVDPALLNLGFMNVYFLDNTPAFASGWGFNDLVFTYDAYQLTLSPNTIGDPNEYWYQCLPGNPGPNCGEPGAPGNKIMEANGYAQDDDGNLSGMTVTFSFEVLSNTLTNAHEAFAFIRDFAPDFSSFTETVVPLTAAGPYSISLATDPAAGRHVQYGFQMKGVNVWVTDTEPFGTVVIGPDWTVSDEDSDWGTVKSLYR